MSSSAQALVQPSFKNILFATDFSPSADAALPYARVIAGLYGSTIHFVHAMNSEAVRGEFEFTKSPNISEPPELRQKLEQLSNSALVDGVQSTETIERGTAWEVVSQLALARHIDLVVTGTHGRGGIKLVLLGSVAEQIFRNSTCPVLTVGPEVRESKGTIATILFATDFTPDSLHAFKYALSLARTNKAKLVLCHAVPDSKESLVKAIGKAEEQLSALMLMEPGIDFQVAASCGPAANVILAEATKCSADLIVMSAYAGASAPARMPWAVPHQVVCYAPCPMLTVRT